MRVSLFTGVKNRKGSELSALIGGKVICEEVGRVIVRKEKFLFVVVS
jgi:hypothetical protein